jgi:4-hydroxy-tetrahydrodipicolinate reductase
MAPEVLWLRTLPEVAIRVGVFGAGGRMGSTVCAAIASDRDTDLVAAVDPHHEGIDLHLLVKGALEDDTADVPELTVAGDASAFERAEVDVVVDFTRLDAACENLAWAAAAGVHAVVGTTGFSAEDYERFRQDFDRSNCLIAPNFAIGAVLMMRFAEIAAPYFETAEVIEYHHDGKIDAPSGTAMLTVERMAQASGDWAEDPTEKEVVASARGGKGPAGIPVHSVRMRGMIAHQEVLLGTAGQTLTIRHDSFDRVSFMPGVLLGVKAIAGLPGLTVGLDEVLGL